MRLCVLLNIILLWQQREKTVIVLSRIKFECENGVRSALMLVGIVLLCMYINRRSISYGVSRQSAANIGQFMQANMIFVMLPGGCVCMCAAFFVFSWLASKSLGGPNAAFAACKNS